MHFSDQITAAFERDGCTSMAEAALPNALEHVKEATPPEIVESLAQLRMLQGVPFNNLVPDVTLLPHESIRFFYLDRAWTDALVQGALSAATVNTIERAQLGQLYPKIEAEVDQAERNLRAPGGEEQLTGSAGQITGFLMRSAAVAGWPGLHVRAYSNAPNAGDEDILPESHPDRIKVLRLERLAPAVLLVLFDGVPDVVHIEEPRQGVQFGVKLEPGEDGTTQAFVAARNVETASYVDENGEPVELSRDAAKIPVRFRPGAAGVVDMTSTANAFALATGTGMAQTPDNGGRMDGATFALQMLRFPYRQIFAQSETDIAAQMDAFTPSLAGIPEQYSDALQAMPEED